MKRHELERLAKAYRAGKVPLASFCAQVLQATEESTEKTPVEDSTPEKPASAILVDTTLDISRAQRCGFPEVVYGEGKSVETIVRIFEKQREHGDSSLATRIDADKGAALKAAIPEGIYHELGRTFRLPNEVPSWGKVGLVTAGTSDLPVAEEARETLRWMGIEPVFIQDVGVAGPHRFAEQAGKLRDADVVIVVAGMEGALPSVVGGYLACPVIAVPTSVGYGASFQGVAALLGMLNSCASNVTVVNIDAGFKGAYLAGLISRRVQQAVQ
ncbi:nickel pincer cofactor biosynthesis protein LarB [Blastopirellula marina]|uniref:1-(5-phosphoribosyl)-5-amino-4-imidazole-carboxylate carboxylase n=1 Tax=Blastopirellula marina TaxID=124 RepID=A0A2S8GEJ1_9BACT|nr:nickel pincer cofactor biosynthesis protein LarB [Blastopirellula marina]PQO42876.1 1-(5-phosphoribosyl)-5-amino-4-imidazole-carboxylate carboxylase [Blastopirellula marina]PTL46642.1 nickel pincer cofactor biosynthesis protein LarB [Blastopirellula marina]